MNTTFLRSCSSRSLLFCRHCGRRLREDDCAMVYESKILCDTCISELNIEELIRICEISNIYGLLLVLGFRRI